MSTRAQTPRYEGMAGQDEGDEAEGETGQDEALRLPYGVTVRLRHLPELGVVAVGYWLEGALLWVADEAAGDA